MRQRFNDHFSSGSREYALARPGYPRKLFEFVVGKCRATDHALDCAAGSGQASIGLSDYFSKVTALDASSSQIEYARSMENITYLCARSEQTGLAANSVDLIVVAQALHWFSFAEFFAECERVLDAHGVLACWCYQLLRSSPSIDAILLKLHDDILAADWPKQRQHVVSGYHGIELPFHSIATPTFSMEVEWDLQQLLGYLDTWSAVKRYQGRTGINPLGDVLVQLSEHWGSANEIHRFEFPMVLKMSSKYRPIT